MIAEPTHNCWQEVGKLNGRSLCKSRLHEGKLAYALDDHTVQLLHLANGKLELLKTGHTKRINNVVLGGGAILTASNDGSVRLYDERVFKQVGCFKKNQNQFYSAAMDGASTIAGGATGSLLFWDVRTRAQLRCFDECFNEEVAGLEFNKLRPSNLYGCGLDGIVSSFDLTQADEEDSVEWSQRLNNSASSITADGAYLRVHTTDHHLFLLKDGDIVKKYSVNSPETPKHLLWSGMDCNDLGYYTWNINNQRLQRWLDGTILTTAQSVLDIDSLEQIEHGKALIADEQGRLLIITMSAPEPATTQIEPEPIQEQEYDYQRMDSEGFVRTNFKKSRKPTFRPL